MKDEDLLFKTKIQLKITPTNPPTDIIISLTSMASRKLKFGGSFVSVQRVSRACLEGFRRVSGVCLKCLEVSARCLEGFRWVPAGGTKCRDSPYV